MGDSKGSVRTKDRNSAGVYQEDVTAQLRRLDNGPQKEHEAKNRKEIIKLTAEINELEPPLPLPPKIEAMQKR